jgi:anti-sigma B factor antagonist
MTSPLSPDARVHSMLLRIDISTQDSSATISPVGEIDLGTVGLLSASLSDTIAAGADRVVVDFAHVTYIDSAGLGALVGAHKKLRASGGALVLLCEHPRVMRLLKITGLTQLFTIESAGAGGLASAEMLDSAVG